ncbi:MAG: hypothetical protein ACO1SX_00535 [Actinomycetota bacterium]
MQATGLAFNLWVLGTLITALVLLALLHQAPAQVKRLITVSATFLAGLFYALEFFIPPDPVSQDAILLGKNLTQMAGLVGQATQVVAGFTFLLGVYNLTYVHGGNIRRRRVGWPNSLAFFIAFLLMAVFAFWRDWRIWFGGQPPPLWVRDTNPAHVARPHDVYTLLFDGLYRNLEATMFSILAFYIVSAAYRAFRVRSGEAGLLMVVAIILMLGQVPLGMALTNWIPADGQFGILRVETLSQYILTAINSPVQRAIGFGIGLGMLAMALRIWLSLERGSYFEEGA